EVGEGKINLNTTVGTLIPKAYGTNKANITLKELLAHQAGLPAWIGFYKESVNVQNARLYLDYYSRKQDEEHPIKVTDNIYIIGSIRDTIMTDILHAPLGPKKLEYSDLGYYLYQEYFESTYKKPLNFLFYEKYYSPMGLRLATFNPLNGFPKEKFIQPKLDKTYGNNLCPGYALNQGVSMMGEVPGLAELFSRLKI